jgi:hypothetical protein
LSDAACAHDSRVIAFCLWQGFAFNPTRKFPAATPRLHEPAVLVDSHQGSNKADNCHSTIVTVTSVERG